MRAATHGCNEGSIEAGWLGQAHLPVMLNYVPTMMVLLLLLLLAILYDDTSSYLYHRGLQHMVVTIHMRFQLTQMSFEIINPLPLKSQFTI